MNTQNFVRNGIYNLKYPEELRKKVLSALDAWKRFVETDDVVTEQFPYAHGVGYEHQKGGGETKDHKKDFHYTEDGAEFLFGAASKSGEKLRQVSEDLIKEASYLVGYLGPSVLQFANELEREIGIENFANEVMASRGTWFLRFLHYPGDRQIGEYMAVPHIDKSAFTFHLYESDPGLQALTYDEKKWVDTPVSESETVIFPGFQLQQKTKGKVQALCHRVVATEKTCTTGRYSMVVFFSLKNTPKYDKTQGRLQDFTPGFNYELSPDDVERMFK